MTQKIISFEFQFGYIEVTQLSCVKNLSSWKYGQMDGVVKTKQKDELKM